MFVVGKLISSKSNMESINPVNYISNIGKFCHKAYKNKFAIITILLLLFSCGYLFELMISAEHSDRTTTPIETVFINARHYYNCLRLSFRMFQLSFFGELCTKFSDKTVEDYIKNNISKGMISLMSCYTGKLCNDPAEDVCNSCSFETAGNITTVCLGIFVLIILLVSICDLCLHMRGDSGEDRNNENKYEEVDENSS